MWEADICSGSVVKIKVILFWLQRNASAIPILPLISSSALRDIFRHWKRTFPVRDQFKPITMPCTTGSGPGLNTLPDSFAITLHLNHMSYLSKLWKIEQNFLHSAQILALLINFLRELHDQTAFRLILGNHQENPKDLCDQQLPV